MSFNKNLICLGLSALVFSSASMAFDKSNGTVVFNGEIVDTPCAITTDNKSLKSDLGNVKASDFKAKGTPGVSTSDGTFKIILSNCTVGTGDDMLHASVSFEPTQTIDDTTMAVGNGDDKSGKPIAIGVGIQILSNNTPVSLGSGVTATKVDINNKEITIPFTARYISTDDTVSPGNANANANFVVSYE